MNALLIFGPLIGGMLIGRMSRPDWWYTFLHKPSWNPPSWVFGPVWTVLYLLMGIATWKIRSKLWGWAGLTFAVQLALNYAWSPVFFRRRDLRSAAILARALFAAVLVTTVTYASLDPVAGALLLPYLGWTAFAAVLADNVKNLSAKRI